MTYMKSLGSAIVLIWCMGAATQSAKAQEQIKVLCYNLLNYPNPEIADNRSDTLKKIIDFYQPDVFLMQELRNPTGLDNILNQSFNSGGVTNYSAGTWLWQVSAPWSSFKLHQNVIYNHDKLTLVNETFVQTGTRDLNVFKFMVNDPNIAVHNDTTFLYTLSVHLKASQGASNVAERLQMATILTGYLETLEPGAFVVLAGDFNVYNSSEPAYQHLTGVTQSAFVLDDPINSPGNWHDNASFSHIHTQSTRTSQLNGDGAGGGLDDRFDFILLSESIMEQGNRVEYVADSYDNLGYTGGCLNQNLLTCPNSDVPFAVKRALYFMSDHLPVKLELEVFLPLTTNNRDLDANLALLKGANAVRDRLDLSLPKTLGHGHTYQIVDMLGHTVGTGRVSDAERLVLNVSDLAPAWYILYFPEAQLKPFRFLKV